MCLTLFFGVIFGALAVDGSLGPLGLPGIIAACQHCADAAWAMDLFREMVCKMLRPNTSSYNALLAACESATLWEECLCRLQMEEKLGDARFSQMFTVITDDNRVLLLSKTSENTHEYPNILHSRSAKAPHVTNCINIAKTNLI